MSHPDVQVVSPLERATEMPPTVSLLGAPGAFHDIACDYLSPESGEAERSRCRDFNQIVGQLEAKEVDRAVIAIANSEIGALKDAYGVLAANSSSVVGEVYLRIRHNLLVLPEVESVEEITDVHSNPKALEQCTDFLTGVMAHARQRNGADTATCALQVAQTGNPLHAAVASHQAAQKYGLKVLSADIQTNPDNQTRFWLLEKSPRYTPDANKTSLILATPNIPGALYDVLGIWADNDINLDNLQSRQKPHQIHNPWGAYLQASGDTQAVEDSLAEHNSGAWESHFDIDVDAGVQEAAMQQAMAQIALREGVQFRILGSYLKGEIIA